MHTKNKKMWGYVGGAVVIAALVFWGGMQYGQSNAQSSTRGNFSGARTGRQGGFMSGGFVGGEVISVDDKSITLKMQDGSTRFVFFSPSTKISKSVDGTISDVAAGKQISVTGTANSDGSMTAQSIQIRPNIPRPAGQ